FACIGCQDGAGPGDYGATVDAFTGQLVHRGKPVSFETEETVILQLVYQEKGERLGVPLKSDGTFTIGWMPIGNYSAIIQRQNPTNTAKRGASAPRNHTLPGGLTIVEGKTEYAIELGDRWKP